MKKVLVLADIYQDSIRARDTLRHLARSLPTLLLSHGYKTIQTRCNRLLKGDLEWLWASCTKLGRSRQTRLAANPHTGKARTATQLNALAQKQTGPGRQFFQVLSGSVLGFNTVAGSLHSCQVTGQKSAGECGFDKTFWPSATDMDTLRQEDDWRRVVDERFSVDNIRKYYARSPPLSAQDADG